MYMLQAEVEERLSLYSLEAVRSHHRQHTHFFWWLEAEVEARQHLLLPTQAFQPLVVIVATVPK